jgi:hypothetical protein
MEPQSKCAPLPHKCLRFRAVQAETFFRLLLLLPLTRVVRTMV